MYGKGTRDVAGNRDQLFQRSIDLGDGLPQGPGVRMERFIEDGLRVRMFHDQSQVHHHYLVGHAADDRQVVADVDDGHVEVILQFLNQLQDLGLNRHIQRGGGFVRNQQGRIAGQRHGNHGPLAHAARQFMGKGVHGPIRARNADPPQQVHGPFTRGLRGRIRNVQQNGLAI